MASALVRTQVQFTHDQHECLKREAAEAGISLSELLRRMADEHVARTEVERRRQGMVEAIRRLDAMQITADVTDASVRHDDYFAEAALNDDLR